MWAIVGGSGFEKFDGFETVEHLGRETPFGPASSGLRRVRIGDRECLFLSRHGEHHEKLPSEINYRANIYALKQWGAQAILSFSAVGSLHIEYKPGDMVVPTQYIDRTKGLRDHSFCGEEIVGHVSLAQPICHSMVEKVADISSSLHWDSHFKKTYVCIEGPYFSTKAESNFYRSQGADIIGMTHYPEFALAREAGLSYLPCCFVTDYDCWNESIPHVTLKEVLEVMKANNAKAFALTTKILDAHSPLYADCDCPNQGLRTALLSPPEAMSHQQRHWVDILTHLP